MARVGYSEWKNSSKSLNFFPHGFISKTRGWKILIWNSHNLTNTMNESTGRICKLNSKLILFIKSTFIFPAIDSLSTSLLGLNRKLQVAYLHFTLILFAYKLCFKYTNYRSILSYKPIMRSFTAFAYSVFGQFLFLKRIHKNIRLNKHTKKKVFLYI